jgi:hypothetical protein
MLTWRQASREVLNEKHLALIETQSKFSTLFSVQGMARRLLNRQAEIDIRRKMLQDTKNRRPQAAKSLENELAELVELYKKDTLEFGTSVANARGVWLSILVDQATRLNTPLKALSSDFHVWLASSFIQHPNYPSSSVVPVDTFVSILKQNDNAVDTLAMPKKHTETDDVDACKRDGALCAPCDRVVRLPQTNSMFTCWFNAILMCMFLSQGMRQAMLVCLKRPNAPVATNNIAVATNKLLTELGYLLDNYRVHDYAKAIEVYKHLQDNHAGHLLSLLHNINPDLFRFKGGSDEDASAGYAAYEQGGYDVIYSYVPRLLDVIGATGRYALLHAVVKPLQKGGVLKYDLYGAANSIGYDTQVVIIKEFGILPTPMMTGAVIMVSDVQLSQSSAGALLLKIGDFEFSVDSALLNNIDFVVNGHAIAGVTCDGDRRVYSGFTQYDMDPAKKSILRPSKAKPVVQSSTLPRVLKKKNLAVPCPLFRYDWLNPNSDTFIMHTGACFLLQSSLHTIQTAGDERLLMVCGNKQSALV